MYKTMSKHRNINMKSQINIISTMTTSDFISIVPPGVPGSMEVSIVEVVSAVCQMRPKAAPGLDDIPVSILKENLFIIAP